MLRLLGLLGVLSKLNTFNGSYNSWHFLLNNILFLNPYFFFYN